MAWYVYLAHFIAGIALVNGIPHLVNGLSGRKFPSPFGKPPGYGESSPTVNSLWGLTNWAIGYALLTGVGPFVPALSLDALVVGGGALAMSVRLASHFGHLDSK